MRQNLLAKIFVLNLSVLTLGCALKAGKQPRHEVASLYSASSPEFRQAAGSLLGPNFVPGNNITTLVNGNQIFPSMLSAIRSAKHSINFETYVFWDGQIAREFTEALAEREARYQAQAVAYSTASSWASAIPSRHFKPSTMRDWQFDWYLWTAM